MAIDRKPVTTDDSIYISGGQAGLTRLDRKSFEKVWVNTEADRLFAVNSTVVYAGDRRGNLLVLDKSRGLKLATLDVRSFNFPVQNDRDNRLLLAANNGMLLCLHDRGSRQAELLRPKEPKPPSDPRDFQSLKDPADPKIDPMADPMMPKKDPEVKKDPEPKKEEPKKEPEPEPKKEEPKKEPDPDAKKDEDLKKDADAKKEDPDGKKDAEPKKELEPK